jgi:hypothetical protein
MIAELDIPLIIGGTISLSALCIFAVMAFFPK